MTDATLSRLDRYQIETIRGVLQRQWRKAGHSIEVPNILCDMALSSLSEIGDRGASSPIPDGYAEWKLLGIDRRKPAESAAAVPCVVATDHRSRWLMKEFQEVGGKEWITSGDYTESEIHALSATSTPVRRIGERNGT